MEPRTKQLEEVNWDAWTEYRTVLSEALRQVRENCKPQPKEDGHE